MENIDLPHKEAGGSGSNSYLIPGAIIIAGAIVGVAIIYTSSPHPAPVTGQAAVGASQKAVVPADLVGNAPSLGNPDAQVKIVEFGDFQCPFCGRFFQTTEKQIIDQYVKSGKARFVYRNFAFLGEESETAASAAQCAHEQGKFWQYHDYLFSHQQGENQGAFSKENLKAFARAVGLLGSQFDSCLDSDKYLEAVRRDTEEGRNAGVSGTPGTFVNGRLVQGAVPFTQFQAIIEEELKKYK